MTQEIKGPLKEIHFVTGKGGVGKSTYAAILAHEIAKQGKKTLLAEIGDRSFYSHFLNIPVTYKPTPVRKNLEIAHWRAEECLKSYALSLLRVEALYKILFQNPVSRSLIQVAPSLAELSIIGQITSAPRQHGPHGDHEVLVIDAFATGHFLNLVRSPEAMGQTIQIGPMGEQSRHMDFILKESGMCHLHIVTTSEELPLTEAFELQAQLEQEFGWQAHFVLNRYLKTSLTNKSFPKDENQLLLQVLRDKLYQQEMAISEIEKRSLSLVKVPLVKSMTDEDELNELEDQLL